MNINKEEILKKIKSIPIFACLGWKLLSLGMVFVKLRCHEK